MSVIERGVLDDFVAACALDSSVTVSRVFHPDLDETWVHLSRDDLRATVSFADDDAKVYVVLRSPGVARRVYHDSPQVVAGLVRRFLGA